MNIKYLALFWPSRLSRLYILLQSSKLVECTITLCSLNFKFWDILCFTVLWIWLSSCCKLSGELLIIGQYTRCKYIILSDYKSWFNFGGWIGMWCHSTYEIFINSWCLHHLWGEEVTVTEQSGLMYICLFHEFEWWVARSFLDE